VHDVTTVSPNELLHETLGPHSQSLWECWQQVNPAFGVQLVLGPGFSMPQVQLPSALVWRHVYELQLHVRPAPGHPRSAQQTPFGTLLLEHAAPLGVFPDWR
jgi:hypothetical protein